MLHASLVHAPWPAEFDFSQQGQVVQQTDRLGII